MVRHSTRILLGIVALAVVATVAASWLTRSTSEAGSPSASTKPSGNQAHQVAEVLGRLTTDPGSLVATGSREQVGRRARDGVPAGSTVEVGEASWAPDGVGGGTISVTLRSPGQPPATYAVVMVSESGNWKVAATTPLAEPAR